MRASVSQTHVSRCLIILRQRARDEAENPPWVFFSPVPPKVRRGTEREKREKKKGETHTPGRPKETKTLRRRTSLDSRRSSRSGLVYLPNASPAFGPAHDLHDGPSSKDGLDFVLLTCSFDKHSGRRNRPPPRSSRWARILGKTGDGRKVWEDNWNARAKKHEKNVGWTILQYIK